MKNIPTQYIKFQRSELEGLRFETDTPRSIAWKTLVGRPEDATVVWFQDDCYGEFWIRDNTAYYNGYIPKFVYQRNYKCSTFNKHNYDAIVGISVGKTPNMSHADAAIRFLIMVDEYKERFGRNLLSKVTW